MAEEIDVRQRSDHSKTSMSESDTISRAFSRKPQQPKPKALIVVQMLVLFLIGVGVAYYFFGPRKADPGDRKGKDRVAAVTIAVAQKQAVPIEIRTTGNVQAYTVVNVLPQVGGQLMKVCFTQGDFVKKGDLLFQIDTRQYKAAYDQAMGNVDRDKAQIQAAQANMAKDQAQVGSYEANLTKDQAQLKFSTAEDTRYNTLVGQGAVSREQSDQMVANATAAQATVSSDKMQIENGKAVVASDRAQIETARGTLEVDQAAARNASVQLSWCQIRSPMDGRTSTLNVYEGNVVAANNQTPLVTIAQVHPIYISFTVPEEYLGQVRRCLNDGTLKVKALIEGIRTDTVLGNASFLEYTVNTSSGTALLRATFANDDNRLYPGQFVDVIVTMPPDGDSVVVPANAVQTTQQGNSVYVAQPDNTVNLVRVDLKRTYGDWAAIGSGINAGDKVVVDGQLQLTPGAKIKVVTGDQSGHRHKAGPAAGSVGPGDQNDQSLHSDASGTPFAGGQGGQDQSSEQSSQGGGKLPGDQGSSGGDNASGSKGGNQAGLNLPGNQSGKENPDKSTGPLGEAFGRASLGGGHHHHHHGGNDSGE
jgi:multidrug efflux system membrane fusion protein